MDFLNKFNLPKDVSLPANANIPDVSLPVPSLSVDLSVPSLPVDLPVNLPGFSSNTGPPPFDYVKLILQKKDPSNIPEIDPERPQLDRPEIIIHHGPAQILQKIPPQFKLSEKPLPISQGLLRIQNFNQGDRFCRSQIVCLEGVIPLPNLLVRTLFSPTAECLVRTGTDYVVTLDTTSVIDMATVLFILCLRKRPLVTRASEGEITEGIQKIMEVLRPASAEFIQQEENPPEEAQGDPDYFPSRCIRFVLKLEEKGEFQVMVNTELQCKLLEDADTAYVTLDALKERLLKPPTPEPEPEPVQEEVKPAAGNRRGRPAIKDGEPADSEPQKPVQEELTSAAENRIRQRPVRDGMPLEQELELVPGGLKPAAANRRGRGRQAVKTGRLLESEPQPLQGEIGLAAGCRRGRRRPAMKDGRPPGPESHLVQEELLKPAAGNRRRRPPVRDVMLSESEPLHVQEELMPAAGTRRRRPLVRDGMPPEEGFHALQKELKHPPGNRRGRGRPPVRDGMPPEWIEPELQHVQEEFMPTAGNRRGGQWVKDGSQRPEKQQQC